MAMCLHAPLESSSYLPRLNWGVAASNCNCSRQQGKRGRREGGADQAVCHAYNTKSCHATHTIISWLLDAHEQQQWKLCWSCCPSLPAAVPSLGVAPSTAVPPLAATSPAASPSAAPSPLLLQSLLLLIAHSKKAHNFFGQIKCKL